jgi:hypothetical protein
MAGKNVLVGSIIKNVPTIFDIEKAEALAERLNKEEAEACDGWTYTVEPDAEKKVAKVGVYDEEGELAGHL